jgi:hypothetical protein
MPKLKLRQIQSHMWYSRLTLNMMFKAGQSNGARLRANVSPTATMNTQCRPSFRHIPIERVALQVFGDVRWICGCSYSNNYFSNVGFRPNAGYSAPG